ncbi:NADH-quinone oxidoreductase subunit NuoH [Chloroflexia bacterium SDU3-3]|nr:NADH-quinone oxidoreductase subunit NuoH [Chloroflexia bacterium SDU3-3]
MVDLIRSLFAQFGWTGLDWLAILIGYFIIAVILLLVPTMIFMLQVWMERRAIARMQDRIGPNRVGPLGLFQSVADGVKMFTKEDIVPASADQKVHLLAPVLVLGPVMMIFAVVPWGRGLTPIELPTALIYVAAVSSISVVGMMMAGWASNNKFALLGAMRSVAQVVSYEVPGAMALLSMVVLNNTMSLNKLNELQAGLPFVGSTLAGAPDLGLGWFVFTPVGLVGFVIYFICQLAEGERTPFDIPEADSEIVAGYMTEYSGMKFAVFYLGQYILNFGLALIACSVFLGGWQGPGVAQLAAMGGVGAFFAVVLSVIYLQAKAWFLFYVMIWLRGAFPRVRVDHLMGFAWKFLLPLALINVMSAGLWATIRLYGSSPAWTMGDALGWLAAMAPWARELLAWAITAVISVAGYIWMLRANRAPADEAIAPAGAAAVTQP